MALALSLCWRDQRAVYAPMQDYLGIVPVHETRQEAKWKLPYKMH